MFKIYGGANKFKQWTKDNKLIMDELPIGADVMFYNDPNEDDPLITEVYEIRDEEDNVFRVCDVPNILLTETKRIKVRIPKVVKGLYGNLYKAAGRNEMIFEVEPAEKPSDYVYEKTVTNTIDPSRLPEGYPWKELIEYGPCVEDDAIDHFTSGSTTYYKVSSDTPSAEEMKSCYVYGSDGSIVDDLFPYVDETVLYDRIIGAIVVCYKTEINFDRSTVTVPSTGIYMAGNTQPFIIKLEKVHPIAAEFLPTSVPAIESASVGQVPKVAAVDENGVPTKWEAGEAKSYSEESWTFTLEDGGTVTKKVAVGE